MEVWKDIKNYEDLYKISNTGKVYSMARPKAKGKELKQVVRHGYSRVTLLKDKKTKSIAVHRLVASHFVSGEEESLVVNHIDGNKSNNNYSNLEWCTQAQNIHHFTKSGKVVQFDLSGNKLRVWNSALEAEKTCGFDNSAIIKCCRGKRPHHKNFIWEYEKTTL